MRNRKGITALVLLTLALGIGVNVAIFSVVDGVLFQPLPYPQSERLVTPLNGHFPGGYYAGLREREHALELAAYSPAGHVTLTLEGQPVQVEGSQVSANFFAVMGVKQQLGSGFPARADAPQRDGYAVLSDRLWRQRFGGRRTVLGTVVNIGGMPRQIVGVMSAGFGFPSEATEVWVPKQLDPGALKEYWMTYDLQLVGRLRPGATLAQARGEIQHTAAEVAGLFPYPIPKTWGTLFPLVTLQDSLVGQISGRLLLLLGAVGLVLLIACVNVVNLLLIAVGGRRREIAVRLALGAGSGRIVRQLVKETMGLALAGGALGLLLAAWGVPILVRALPAATPHLAAAGLHLRALGFAVGITLLVGLITGLVPGWRAGAVNIEHELRSGGSSAGTPRARQRLAAGLLVAEVAIAVVVMVGGALLATSLIRLSHTDPGFQATGVTTLDVAPSDAYCAVAGRCANFYRRLQEQVAAQPGVGAVALTNAVPLGGVVPIGPALFQDHPLLPGAAIPLVWANLVTPGYLHTLGIPLLSGRGFTAADGAGAQKVVMINASLAKKLWPRESPLGKSVATVESGYQEWNIVGVVADVDEMVLGGDPDFFQGEVYYPYAQALATPPVQGSLAPMTLVMRPASVGLPPPSASQLHGIISGLNPDVPVTAEQRLSALVYANQAAPRITTGLFLLFAVLALVLGAIGVYGVMWHNVTQRTREFGVRMALGAERRRVLQLVLRRGMTLAVLGIVAGLAVAAALSRLLAGLLYQVSPADPWAFAAAAAVVAATALFACLWPARQATRVDPNVALRQE